MYGAWPGSLWGEPTDLGAFSLGILWQPPNTDPATYYQYGDQPWFVEYHWHGLQLVTGNAFILGGLALFVVILAATVRVAVRARRTRPLAGASAASAPGGARSGADPAGTSEPSRALCSRRGYPSCRERGRSHAPRHTAVPCRSCREPAAARAPAAGARASPRLASSRPGPAGGRGRRHRARPCGCRRAGCRRPPTVSPPGVLAQDFIYPSAAITQAPGTMPCGSATPGALDVAPARCGRERSAGQTIFGDSFRSSPRSRREPKLTIPSPNRCTTAAARPSTQPSTRTSRSSGATCPARTREEVRRLGELGCTYLQSTTPACLPERPGAAGEIAERGETPSICTCATSSSQRRARRQAGGMAVTTHMCRGNFRSSWAAAGGYDFVAERCSASWSVDGFFLEYDDARPAASSHWVRSEGQDGRSRPRHHQARRRSRRWTSSSAASTRRPSTSRSTSSACPRSAVSPPRSKATR